MVFGTFDIFHAGHESLLKQAKQFGDHLIVVVARDETVQKVKGRKPENNEKQRVAFLEKNSIADKVVLGNTGNKYKVIKKYCPDVIALGYDQFTFTYGIKKFLIDEAMNTEIIRLKPYNPGIYKSSIIKGE